MIVSDTVNGRFDEGDDTKMSKKVKWVNVGAFSLSDSHSTVNSLFRKAKSIADWYEAKGVKTKTKSLLDTEGTVEVWALE